MMDTYTMEYMGDTAIVIQGTTFKKGSRGNWRHRVDTSDSTCPAAYEELLVATVDTYDLWQEADTENWRVVKK